MHRIRHHGLLVFLLLLVCLVCIVAPPILQAQSQPGSFTSIQPVVAPLQPAAVNVNIPGYSGPASLIIFDSTRRPVGAWDFSVVNGYATVQVTPRGSLGEHWAALFASGQPVANGAIYFLEAQTTVRTGRPAYDLLYGQVRGFMAQNTLNYPINNHYVHGYRSPDSPLLWLRDHYYQGRGFRYFESDVKSLLDGFRRAQQPDGSLPDFVDRPEWNVAAFRTPVEADVEYLYVQAVYEAWQMTGDDQWMLTHLPAMQRAISYTLTSGLRWEPTLGLVKRPFTIDTWDFEYGPTTIDPGTGRPAPRHWIDDQTRWGIFHGDNTGLAQALTSLSRIEAYVGQPGQAQFHHDLAVMLMARLNVLSWNGRFYTHHVKLIPWDVPGVDEASQLSLSNAIALNRNVLTVEQGRAIIDEYRSRLRRPGNIAFAEWWSIDPPFPAGSFGLAGRVGELPGEYVNGGIMPLVGGELARGAFRYGYEEYGFDVLRRYFDLISRTNATYLWYFPTGGIATGPDFLATDGWGSSAMLGALLEGAAGIEDNGVRYSDVTISPRWLAANENITDTYIVTRYAASDGYAAYRWQYSDGGSKAASHLVLEATGSGEQMRLRLLLPKQVTPEVPISVTLNGQPVTPTIETIGESRYVMITAPNGIVQVQVTWVRD